MRARSASSLAVTVALAACGPAPAPAPHLASHGPTRSTMSCALASPRRSSADVTLARWLGRVGDRSWALVVHRERYALAGLTADGALALIDLPARVHDDTLDLAVDGARLWLVVGAPGLDLGDEVLYALDLDRAAPQPARVAALTAKTIPGATTFAVGAARALFFTFAGGARLELWDRPRGAPLITEAIATTGLDAPRVRCVDARCFATIADGDGPPRRLTALRFTDAGVERTRLADDHLGEHHLVAVGGYTVVLWDSFSRPGVFARTLDTTGAPVDDEVTLVATTARDARPVPGGPVPGGYLAYRADDWRLARTSDDYRRVLHTVPLGLPRAEWLEAATTTDGVLAIGFSTDVAYHGESLPPTTAHAVFVPHSGVVEPAVELLGGARRESYVALPLVTPGYAAALVISQDTQPADGELVLLRTPCR